MNNKWHNFSWNYSKSKNSYVYSGYFHFGGWATWKRSWEKVSLLVEDYIPKLDEILQQRFTINSERKFFKKEFGYNLNHTSYDGWDYQAALTVWERAGLCIVPGKNLVSNIGTYGTHFTEDKPFFNLLVSDDFKIVVHPDKIERDSDYDSFHFRNHWKKVNKRPLFRRVFFYLRKRYRRLTDNGLF